MAQNLIQLITVATVNRADGTATIVGRPTAREDGTTTPEIFGAQVAADPLIVDGVKGAEGQLIMNTTSDGAPATLDTDGELTITPEQEDADLYTRGSVDDAYLLWSDEQTDGGVPVEVSDIKLVVQLNPIVSGQVTLTTFEIDTTGAAETVEWRVSEDGVFWTEWVVLTEASLSARTWIVENSLLIQLRLTPTSDSVTFRSVTLVGTWSGVDVSLPTLDASILAEGWATEEARALERNIFLKLYRRGIIPNYIRRGDNDSYDEDRDYVDLWFSVARLAALFIVYFRRWERWWTDVDLLQETLDAYGLYYQRGNSDLETLQYLVSHLLDQARVRGTESIFHRTEEGYEVDGEFVRLLQNTVCDELLYENIPNWRVGWVMGQSSPLYRGTARAWALNKTGENGEDFVDPSNYLITHTANVTAEIIDIEDTAGIRRGVLRITCGDWSTADDPEPEPEPDPDPDPEPDPDPDPDDPDEGGGTVNRYRWDLYTPFPCRATEILTASSSGGLNCGGASGEALIAEGWWNCYGYKYQREQKDFDTSVGVGIFNITVPITVTYPSVYIQWEQIVEQMNAVYGVDTWTWISIEMDENSPLNPYKNDGSPLLTLKSLDRDNGMGDYYVNMWARGFGRRFYVPVLKNRNYYIYAARSLTYSSEKYWYLYQEFEVKEDYVELPTLYIPDTYLTDTPNSGKVSPLAALEESITVTPASLSYKAQGGTQPVVITVAPADTGWSVDYNPESEEQGGLGRRYTSDVANPLMVVDSELDYEITFRFCILAGSADMTLSFGVEGFSRTQRLLTDAFCGPSRAHVENTFVEQECGAVFQKEEWYYVRGIIHAYGSRRGRTAQVPNIGIGTDLYFNNYFVKYILPKIQFIFTGAGAVDIWDYKVRPLVRGRNIIPLQGGAEDSHSMGFVQSPNWSHTYAHNNSSTLSPAQIANIIESTLYTFDRTNLITLTGYYE